MMPASSDVVFVAPNRRLVYHAKIFRMSNAGRFEERYGFLMSDAVLLTVNLAATTSDASQ